MKPLITTLVLTGLTWLCAGSAIQPSQSIECNNHANCTELNNNTPLNCKHGSDITSSSVSCRTGSVCSVNDDCPVDKACVDHMCKDPCSAEDCGLNSVCRVGKHLPMCACAPGYMGDPFTGCEVIPVCSVNDDCPVDKACVDHMCQDPCSAVDCGLNSVCRVGKHLPMCACAPGYMGDPFTGCAVIPPPECNVHHNCPANSVCINHKCTDPCRTHKCGRNAECQIQDHSPLCSCVTGFKGDATSECILQTEVKPSRATLSTKKFYVDTESKVTWHDALDDCKSRGYRLASVLTDSENKQVLELIEDTGVRNSVFWTAGNDRSKEGDWVWDTTGESISGFSYWQKFQPNNFFNQDCLGYHEVSSLNILYISGYRWNDLRCNKRSNFICEYYE